MNKNDKYFVYENWQAENKAVVHISSCGHAREGHNRLNDYTAPNDRWFGYFETLSEAIAFASLLPNRQLKLCGHCLRQEKENL
jgi:hypothetical protein